MKKYADQILAIIEEARQEGFQQGWKAARDALNAPVPNLKVAGTALSKPKWRRRKAKKTSAKAAGNGLTVEQQVLNYIGDNPGKTGAEIIRALSSLNPKTIRTMLRRLRMAGETLKEGEGWHKK